MKEIIGEIIQLEDDGTISIKDMDLVKNIHISKGIYELETTDGRKIKEKISTLRSKLKEIKR